MNEQGEQVLRLRTDALAWRHLDGEVVAVDLDESLYLTANSSGALLWEALAGGATRRQLVERLAGAYGLEAARAEADVDAFLADARERGLLA